MVFLHIYILRKTILHFDYMTKNIAIVNWTNVVMGNDKKVTYLLSRRALLTVKKLTECVCVHGFNGSSIWFRHWMKYLSAWAVWLCSHLVHRLFIRVNWYTGCSSVSIPDDCSVCALCVHPQWISESWALPKRVFPSMYITCAVVLNNKTPMYTKEIMPTVGMNSVPICMIYISTMICMVP